MKNLYLYLTTNLHPGSLIVTIALDLLWSALEGALTVSVIGILLVPILIAIIFMICFGAVTSIQLSAAHDDWPAALAKGFALGVVAAIPFSVVGLIIGIVWGLLYAIYGVDEEVVLLGKLTRGWRDVEMALRRLAPPEVRNRNIDEVIDYLYDNRILSNELKNQLHELRRLRNINMHEMSTSELSVLVGDVLSMSQTLRGRMLWR
jgi:hypothetical protein